MGWDFCGDVRNRVGRQLGELSLAEVDCRKFGQSLKGHGAMFADEVVFYRGRGRLIAISWSVGNGPSCRVGSDGDDFAAYETWPSLWTILGDDAGLLRDGSIADMEQLDAYLDKFPDGYEEGIDYIAARLAELPC